jgi:hypothetical protein
MITSINLKKELHELIEGITDENLLKALRLILAFRKPAVEDKTKTNSSPSSFSKITLPNGAQISVTPGDSSVETSELFGIWKDHPITTEELRKKAWEGRT